MSAGRHVRLDDGALKRMLTALEQAAGDTTPAMAAVGRSWHTRLQMAFKGGTDPHGAPWAPLKTRQGQPLRDTGTLNRSFTVRASNNRLVLGTATEYAPLHQFGFTGQVEVPAHVRKIRQAFGRPIPETTVQVKAHSRSTNVPARPFLPLHGLPDSWTNSALRILANHLSKAIGRPGGQE